jgi:hypothetical protein
MVFFLREPFVPGRAVLAQTRVDLLSAGNNAKISSVIISFFSVGLG